MFPLTKRTCNWYPGCKLNCYTYVISSRFAPSFVFSNGKTKMLFPLFKLNA